MLGIASFSVTIKGDSSKLTNKNTACFYMKKNPESFEFIQSIIFDLFTVVLQRFLWTRKTILRYKQNNI